MKPGTRIPGLLRELADEFDALLAEEPRSKRVSPVRQPPKFAVVPTELQREKADRLLKAKGLAK